MTAAIQAERIGVRFLFDRQRRLATPALARIRRHVSDAWGLREVTFSMGPGEGVALLGPSGAGKTTLLRTIAGVLAPDAGRIEVRGRVGSLLSTSAGVMGLLTGRENTLLLCALAGLSRGESRYVVEDVKSSSKLEDAFERPVASYSGGMRARLGFVFAEHTEPQILLLDEVHEALDHEFRELVRRRAREILDRGGIVVAAGHDHSLLEQLCDRALLMRSGCVEVDGPFAETRCAYLEEGPPGTTKR